LFSKKTSCLKYNERFFEQKFKTFIVSLAGVTNTEMTVESSKTTGIAHFSVSI